MKTFTEYFSENITTDKKIGAEFSRATGLDGYNSEFYNVVGDKNYWIAYAKSKIDKKFYALDNIGEIWEKKTMIQINKILGDQGL